MRLDAIKMGLEYYEIKYYIILFKVYRYNRVDNRLIRRKSEKEREGGEGGIMYFNLNHRGQIR